jgi:hypothetical protein
MAFAQLLRNLKWRFQTSRANRARSRRQPIMRQSLVPQLDALEDRTVPSLSVVSSHGDLIITGTPTAVGDDLTLVQHVGNDNYQVIDSFFLDPIDLGTYRVTGDIVVSLDSKDGGFIIELAGDVLPGKITIDVGLFDPDPNSFDPTLVGNGLFGIPVGPAKVTKDVTFIGRSGTDRFDIFAFPDTLEIGGNVRARSAAAPAFEPNFGGPGFGITAAVVVHGNMTVTGFTSVDIESGLNAIVVAGNVDVSVPVAPFVSFGPVFLGDIAGNVSLNGGVGVGTGQVFNVGGNVALNLTHDSVSIETFDITGNLRVSATPNVSARVTMRGAIGGSAFLDLGGSANTFSKVDLIGTISGSMNVTSNSGSVNVNIGTPFNTPSAISGNLNLHLGDGSNSLTIHAGSEIGGNVNYHGGTGADTVRINSRSTFRLVVHSGGGGDTVAFAPNARVAFALIDFGTGPGTKTWVPPSVIDFPLILLHFP